MLPLAIYGFTFLFLAANIVLVILIVTGVFSGVNRTHYTNHITEHEIYHDIIGNLRWYAGVRVPDKWIPCDGRVLSKKKYPELFQVVKYVFGGDGDDQFQLPNVSGRTIINQGHGTNLSAREFGIKSGSATTTLLEVNLPAHNHPLQTNMDAFEETFPEGNVIGYNVAVIPYNAEVPEAGEFLNGSSMTGDNAQVNIQDPFIVLHCLILATN